MYLNDVHIISYVLVGLLGIFTGHFVDWCNKRLPEYKKVLTKEFFIETKMNFKPNYILILTNVVVNLVLLYNIGLKQGVIANLDLIKFIILIPMLLSVFVIDYKHLIIPNRLNLTMFEIGLIFTFIYGISNLNIALSMLLGMLAGGGIFLLITLIGGLIAGKEAMGFGDVKLMGALGLFFGVQNIVVISIVAFLVAAVISIILIVFKIRKSDEYIPFGPFIVIGAFIVMLVPFSAILNILLKIFTLGMYK